MSRKFLIACTIIGTLMHAGNPFAMGEDASHKTPVSPPEDWPVVTVPGRIVFQSNRDGALGEIWLLERGRLKKLATSNKTSADLPKEIPALLHTGLTELREPRWSPDGSRILYLSEGKLILMNPEGKLPEIINPHKYAYSARWAPDGQAIYYRAEDKLPQGGGSDNIYRLNLRDRSERQVTNLSPMPGVRSVLSFAVSPDDKQIVFCMVGEQEYGISLWRVGTDGTGLELLVRASANPAWSPDGTKLAYASNYLPSRQKISEFDEIFIYDMKTGRSSRVTNNNWDDSQPVFSPDGTKIAFKSARHRMKGYGSEIFIINLDGTGEARLTPPHPNPKYPNDPIRGWATDEHPDWTP